MVVTGSGASPHPEGYITLDDLKRAVRGGFYGFRLSSQESELNSTLGFDMPGILIRMVSEYLLDMFLYLNIVGFVCYEYIIYIIYIIIYMCIFTS